MNRFLFRIAVCLIALTCTAWTTTAAAQRRNDPAEDAYREGVTFLSRDEDAKSQEPLERALKLAPDDKFRLKVYEALVPAYTLLPEIDKKLEALEFIIEKSDSAASRSLARRSMMSFVHQRGKTEVMIMRYEDVLKKDPNHKTALFILSEAYVHLKPNPKRATELIEKLSAITKQAGGKVDVATQAGLAGQYIKAGKTKEGAELYELIADADPKLAAWHWKEAALAWLKLKEKSKALAAAKASAASPPESRGELLEHFWHKALADVFLETGEPKLAVPHYEKAIEKTKIDGYIKDCEKKLAEARGKIGK